MPRPTAKRSASTPAAIAALADLGLTTLEGEVYQFLLAEPGSTGYRIAQALGKPVGNIYKAVESLESKGAVASSDDAGNRTSIAIPLEEWIRARRRVFDRACEAAIAALQQPALDAGAATDDALYRLNDRDQVLERARGMMAQARQFVIAIIAPPLVGACADALHQASRRIPVALKCFDAVDIPGVRIVLDPRRLHALTEAPGAWLMLSADGRESLFALFDSDGATLHTAHWSRNPLLAWSHYSGLSSDLLLASVRGRLAEGASLATIEQDLMQLQAFETPSAAGKISMKHHYRRGPRRNAHPA